MQSFHATFNVDRSIPGCYNFGMDSAFSIDARGIPTRQCPMCGSELFTIQAIFDEDYNIAGYLLNAECAYCTTKLTAPTPLDLIGEYNDK